MASSLLCSASVGLPHWLSATENKYRYTMHLLAVPQTPHCRRRSPTQPAPSIQPILYKHLSSGITAMQFSAILGFWLDNNVVRWVKQVQKAPQRRLSFRWMFGWDSEECSECRSGEKRGREELCCRRKALSFSGYFESRQNGASVLHVTSTPNRIQQVQSKRSRIVDESTCRGEMGRSHSCWYRIYPEKPKRKIHLYYVVRFVDSIPSPHTQSTEFLASSIFVKRSQVTPDFHTQRLDRVNIEIGDIP